MEFAICLNHVLQMSGGSVELAEAFIRDYAEFRTCSRQEIEQLHVLTQVYHLVVLHFYIGQHVAGNVIEQNFTYILNQFYTRHHWLAQNSERIQALLQTYLLEEK
ncbi:hypothetical protein D3C85_1188330 [compost metagenome]